MQRDGLLVPTLTVTDYSEEQIDDKDERCADQADDPRIAECRLCREFGPSILFGEGLDDLQHQRFAVLLIAQQDHTIALLICEEEGQVSKIRSRVGKIPIGAISRDSKA